MRYFKVVQDGYILMIGEGTGGTEITETEYTEILALIQERPTETSEIGYRLKTDLTWESYEKEPPDPDPEMDDSEALDILLGGEDK